MTAAGAPGARGGLRRWLERERVFKWLPFVPVQGLFALLLLPNFLLLVYLSLLSWRITRGAWWNAAFTGLDSFQRALEDSRFLWALARTFAFAAVAVPLELLLGFGLAMLCRRSFRGRRIYTSVFLLPMMIVPAVVGYDLSMLLIDQGPFNQLLSLFAGRTVTVSSESPEISIREHYHVADRDNFIYRMDASNDRGKSWNKGQIEMTFRRSS